MITEINPVSVDNMKGFEIVGAGKSKDNTPALVYQLMVFDETGDYYMVVGQCKDTLTDYLNVYKSIARSFKRK